MEQVLTERVIDVREYPEFAGGHLRGDSWVRLSELGKASDEWSKSEPLLLVCQGGVRAEQGRVLLAAKGFENVRVLAGGVERWKSEGGALEKAAGAVWSMERQVRVVAGSLILLSLGLAFLVSQYFLWLTGLVGAGLVFAGVSNTCMMAKVLGGMPWNRA